MEKKIWTTRPYYYFTLPYIRILLKQKDAPKLFLFYEQLLCLAVPTNGQLRYTEKCPYTPFLLASILEGYRVSDGIDGFTEDQVEEFVDILKKLEILDVLEDGTIVLNHMDELVPRASTAKTVEISNQESIVDEDKHSKFTIHLVKAGYLTKKDDLNNWDNFFNNNIDKALDRGVTEEQILEALTLYVTKDVPNYLKEKGRINNKLNFFQKSFLKKIDDLITNRTFTEEEIAERQRAVEIAKTPWSKEESDDWDNVRF